MIKFRQKNYAAWLAATLPSLALEGGIGLMGNAQQKKANEEAAEQQAIANKRMEKLQQQQNEDIKGALDKIAENSKTNPQAVQQATQAIQATQQQYSAVGGILKGVKNNAKNLKGFGKDLGTVVWKRKSSLIGGTLAGATLAGSGYLADKVVQFDMKRSGIPLQKSEKKQKEYALVGKGFLKEAGKTIKTAAKKNKRLIGSMAAFGALPVVSGYAANKQQLKDQINATQEQPKQRSYSIMNLVKGVGKSLRTRSRAIGQSATKTGQSMKKGWKTFKSHPGQSTLGWISNNIAMGGGRRGVEKFGRQLSAMGRKSGNPLTQKAGKFILDHPKTAIGASIPAGLGAMALTWDAGEKLTTKALKKVDKNATAYRDSQNQEVEE